MKIFIFSISIALTSCITYEAVMSNCREDVLQYFRDNGQPEYWEIVTTKDHKKFTYFYDDHEIYFIDDYESCVGPSRAD